MKCCPRKYGPGFNAAEPLSGNSGANVSKSARTSSMDTGFCTMCVREVENTAVAFCNKA